MAAGLQLRLQKSIFGPQGEKLLALAVCQKRASAAAAATATASGRTRAEPFCYYLCLIKVNAEGQGQVGGLSLCLLKASQDREEQLPAKRKRSWAIGELKGIDGKISAEATASLNDRNGGSNADFDLVLNDKTYSWAAVTSEDKRRFLSAVVNYACSGRGQREQQQHGRSRTSRISLVNMGGLAAVLPENGGDYDDDDGAASRSGKKRSKDGRAQQDTTSGYQAISDKEERDLLGLMRTCDYAVTNADLFVEDLQRQLSLLDGANIHSIMASEESVDRLMGMLEEAVAHVESLEKRLDLYDRLMDSVRDSMMMDKLLVGSGSGSGGGDFETVNASNKELLHLLERVVGKLEVSSRQQQVLGESFADYSANNGQLLKEAVEAARSLERALTTAGDGGDFDPCLLQLQSVKDQRRRCERWKDRFAKALAGHLVNSVKSIENSSDLFLGSSINVAAVMELKLTRRRGVHRDLVRYAELVHWLKTMDPASFNLLQSTYRSVMSKMYDRDLKAFFMAARLRVNRDSNAMASFQASSASVGSMSLVDLSKKSSRHQAVPPSQAQQAASSSGGNGMLLGNDNDSLGGSSEVSTSSSSERERFDEVLETALLELESVCLDEQNFSVRFFKMSKANKGNKAEDKAALEAARAMMSEMFPTLESELLAFISAHERADGFFTLHALVRMGRHVMSAQDTGSFLAISLGTVLIQVKRNFDNFMKAQVRSVDEARVPSRRAKCGVLPFVSNLERFLAATEGVFRGSDRRSDAEKWYAQIAEAVFTAIARVSHQHTKTPAEVVKMENFHHLHGVLAQSKIQALEPYKREAKARYQEALRNYVTQYFGRPLEKLNVFFDGVQALVAAGVKESEVGYQLAYSKQELRKVIAAYPGKEVRKGLDNLYKKVERHLCEEEGLVQVVWRAMQEEFIHQYKCIEDLVQRCYPGAQISLEFTIDNVLQYFSDIARSH